MINRLSLLAELVNNCRVSQWFGLLGLSLLLCACSSLPVKEPLGPEPVHAGKPLSEWAEWTLDKSFDGPSTNALAAMAAVRAIGPAKCIPFLVRWIQPPIKNSILPGGAVECFRHFGPEAKAAIPLLAKILEQPAISSEVLGAQLDAAKALSYLGRDAVPVLLAAATRLNGNQVQRELINDMANFGTNGTAAKPAILKWSKDPDGWVRLGALHAYVAIEGDRAAALKLLQSALKDPEKLVRRDAAEALGWVAQGQKAALPLLLEALNDPEWDVQTGAIQGLGMLGIEQAIVRPLLIEKLHHPNGTVRRCAAFALGDVGGKESFDALMKSADDPDIFVREVVYSSLKRIDPDALARSGKKFY